MTRPIDLPSWHEFDYSSITRNFLREGNNILYPRIDWRGDGPGYTEMEFPFQPWLAAQLYRAFGIQEWLERFIPLVAALLSLAALGKLARLLLPETAAFVAALLFAVNRTTLFVASAAQPEALMLLFYLLAVYCFLQWVDKRGWWMYFAAIAAFSCAMLMKSPAAHLGIFFFLVLFQKYKFSLFKQWEAWIFVLLSFAPVVLWYSHAYGLWKTYHNSMGVSNEDHWLGLDILRRPKVILGLAGIEIVFVMGIGGAVALAFASASERVVKTSALWIVSILIYYVVILRTSGQYWAWYYHIVSVPPVALLMAAAARRLSRLSLIGGAAACLLLSTALVLATRRDWSRFPGLVQDLFTTPVGAPAAFGLSAIALALLCLMRFVNKGTRPLSSVAAALLGAAFATYFLVSGQLTRDSWRQFSVRSADYSCTSCFADKIAPDALIVSTGGICKDPAGHKVAGDSPEMFYWLDRKGFSTCEGDESVQQLEDFAHRGARYFIAKKSAVQEQPGLEQALRNRFPLLGQCKTAWLFQLRPGK